MIVEGVVTTCGEHGAVNIAPMGPRVAPDFRRLTLRPFKSSRTYRNLKALGEGVFHVTDDVDLIARAAAGEVQAELRPAVLVKGHVLAGACRAYEFRVVSTEEAGERAAFEAEVVRCEKLRDFLGFNRAKHAVVEAAILATRAALLGRAEVLGKLAGLEVLVEKTGGPAERSAFAFLREHIERTAGSRPERPLPARVHVRTGSRLHFGLLAPGEGGPRRFGGAGLMVDRPGIDLTLEPADAFSVEGPLAERAREAAIRFAGKEPRCRIRMHAAPREHSGLGAGTQLGMAVATALSLLAGGGDSETAAALAARAGRGRRSAIGVRGFELGGFLADAGKGASNGLAPLAARLDVPEEWRFVLATPLAASGIWGRPEDEAFEAIGAAPRRVADAMSRALLLGLIPSIIERDFRAFSEALREYGDLAGECFRAVQGGVYARAEVAALVERARGLGAVGSGQSSWGPTVYAAAACEEEAARLARGIEETFAGNVDILVARPLNAGARVDVGGASTPSPHTLA
jgi:beta-RFAP synthase